MKNRFFTPRMKMADLIAANHSLLLVLPRFGIHLGFGEQSVQEICDRYHLNVDFVLMIFNVYTFHDYLPDEETFAITDLRPLVPYLLSSHRYYLNERLPHIERHLANVAAHAGERYGTILHQFFADYKSEVQDHFAFEEQQVFPILCQADSPTTGAQAGGSMEETDHFADNHSDLIDKLLDLTQIVYKYIPGDSMTEELNELVFGIMQLSSDLEKHAILEEKVLIPYMNQILNANASRHEAQD